MLKKVYEEMVAIRAELQLMQQNTAPTVENLDGVCIKTFCPNPSIQFIAIIKI